MKFSDEYDYAEHLLRCAFKNETPEEKPESLSFERIFGILCEHETANIAFTCISKLKNQPPQELVSRWRQEYYKAVKRDMTQASETRHIKDLLHKNGIDTLELQGTVVKKYYPETHLRMMSDIDFIVRQDSLDLIPPLLKKEGYVCEYVRKNELNAAKNNIYLEFHTEYFPDDSPVAGLISDPFSDAVAVSDGSYCLPETRFYLYHLAHTIKHALLDGCGYRRIADIFILENALKDKADFGYIDSCLKKAGLYKTKKALFEVKDAIFSGKELSPASVNLLREIRLSGNHGTEQIYYEHKFNRDRENGKRFARLRYLFSRVFPAKDKFYSAYPQMKEKELSLFLCHFYRLGLLLRGKSGIKTVLRRLKK